MSDQRKNYLTWDAYFMSVAFSSALRSKDPSTRHGACIVSPKNRIIGTGYNGFPQGCSDEEFPWAREGKDNKNFYVLHSEVNAILNSSSSTENCRMYLFSEKGYYPCCDCAKVIIQSGIKEIIMLSGITQNTDVYDFSPTLKMFKFAEVKIRVLDSEQTFKEFSYLSGEVNAYMSKLSMDILEGKCKTNFEL